MKAHYPVLIVVIPLFAAFVVSGAGWIRKQLCFPIALISMGLTALVSTGLLLAVLEEGTVHYRLGGWEAPWGIVYAVDSLNGVILVVLSFLAFVNLIATYRDVAIGLPQRIGGFYALYILFVTGLMGIVVTGDLFNLYVLLEVASLTSYALIALGGGRATHASLNYVFMGTIGACFYLLGVGYIYIMTGSLNMADVAVLLPANYESRAILIAFIFCMMGVWMKMAFFPLHVWLPNAYTYAPSAVSSLIAPLMTKVMVYVMILLMMSVFSFDFTFHTLALKEGLVNLSALAILVGAFLALAQSNLKKMLTYILISEIGYMVGGAWLGNRLGMTGAILHIINDALMTFCLFLAVGAISSRVASLELKHLKGLFRKMPFTAACFVTGGLSIIGVPPTCGFFSKWYLISAAIQAGHFVFMTALIISSLINAVLFFKIIEKAYFEPMDQHVEHHDEGPAIHEASPNVLVCLLAVSIGLILLGLYTDTMVSKVIVLSLPEGI
jgi:multicomponent Na+:H+ antiporter subunit D